jgi:hypothetical protein
MFTLRQLLLMYLDDLSHLAHTPAAWKFGEDVHSTSADVLTFNYDTLAESAIASASGIGPKPMPESLQGPPDERELTDDDLDASHVTWRSALAHGFEFDEVRLPVAGVPPYVEGKRYYAHPNNHLYRSRRVLKLHGSISWLRYTDQRAYPALPDIEPEPPREGIVLEDHSSFWMGEPPTRGSWRMEPLVVPPQIYKDLRSEPFPTVWDAALETLNSCDALTIIGYSFPPTDFRTRRLFLEAFADHTLQRLVVINPDSAAVEIARHVTHFKGPVVTCDDLQSLYGVAGTWFDAMPPGAPPATS